MLFLHSIFCFDGERLSLRYDQWRWLTKALSIPSTLHEIWTLEEVLFMNRLTKKWPGVKKTAQSVSFVSCGIVKIFSNSVVLLQLIFGNQFLLRL